MKGAAVICMLYFKREGKLSGSHGCVSLNLNGGDRILCDILWNDQGCHYFSHIIQLKELIAEYKTH